MTTHTPSTPTSPLLALPDDVLQRVLVGVPLDDHCTTALVCRTFRAVVTSPQFHAVRRRSGFAERGIVVVGSADSLSGSRIRIVNKSGVEVRILGPLQVDRFASTTDGTRLFFTTLCYGKGCDVVLAVDASSRRWKRLVNMPQNHSEHCMEWHGGLLYVAGGFGQNGERLNSFYAFNEATGIWEDLPPMPQACAWAASGVIGNQLFIACGNVGETLQIYDIASRTWRLGADLPDSRSRYARGYVVDGKLCVMSVYSRDGKPVLVYDPQANTWTEEAPPPSSQARFACVHDGRLVVFQEDGTVVARATDGSWSLCADGGEPQESSLKRSVNESVLLG